MEKILVTSDWRLDRSFARFGRDTRTRRLTDARVSALERVLVEAEAQGVGAVVVLGDVFETPTPSEETRAAIQSALRKLEWKNRTLLFVPGDRDPAVEGSVWLDDEFRGELPDFVRIATDEVTTLELGTGVVVVALPCTSRVRGPSAFPAREDGDRRVRVGVTHVVHGAPAGDDLDLLACGGEDAFQFVDAGKRVVFPGTHEPSGFSNEQGRVALVSINPATRQTLVEPRAVNVLTWERVKLTSLASLRQFSQRADLATRVVKVEVAASLSLPDLEAFERELEELEAREDVFLEVDAGGLTLDASKASTAFAAWPQVLQKTARELLAARGPVAMRALISLSRLVGEGQGEGTNASALAVAPHSGPLPQGERGGAS